MNPIFQLSRRPEERLRSYRDALEAFLPRLTAAEYLLHSPLRRQVRSHRPGMVFHPTPEFFLQLAGRTDFRCPEAAFALEAGQACVMPRGLPHGERVRRDRFGDFRALVVGFQTSRVVFILSKGSEGAAPQIDYADAYELTGHSRLATSLDAITLAAENNGSRKSLQIDAHLRIFIAGLLDGLDAAGRQRGAQATLAYRAQHWIIEGLSRTDLSVAGLAERLACGPDHLTRVFRAHFGTSPSQFIRDERIRMAKGLIEQNRLNFSEIAAACGFAGLNYFSRCFKAVEGSSSRAYDRRLLSMVASDESDESADASLRSTASSR